MTGWALVAIVAIVVWGVVSVLTGRRDGTDDALRGRDANAAATARQPEENRRELEREVETLRERIRVLERIATDSNSTEAREARRISAEIEALRTEEPYRDED